MTGAREAHHSVRLDDTTYNILQGYCDRQDITTDEAVQRGLNLLISAEHVQTFLKNINHKG